MVAEVKGTAVTDYVRGINLICTDSEYYIYNAHGDVVSLTSTSGVVTKTYDYDAFGNETNPSSNDTNPFRYCGEYYDIETGTYYLRARYYDPAVGRFGTEDPARSGLNWYTYCAGNPVRYLDPNGMSFFDSLLNFFSDCWNALVEAERLNVSVNVKTDVAIARGTVVDFWKTGADLYLRKSKNYFVSADMLERSLVEFPEDFIANDSSIIAELINNDKVYLAALDNAIAESNNGKIDTLLEGIAFENGDLLYSIHLANIHVSGYEQDDGTWIINATLTDVYDFTEITTYKDEKGDYSSDLSLASIANDLGTLSQRAGVITPYKVLVNFTTVRRYK